MPPVSIIYALIDSGTALFYMVMITRAARLSRKVEDKFQIV